MSVCLYMPGFLRHSHKAYQYEQDSSHAVSYLKQTNKTHATTKQYNITELCAHTSIYS